MRNHLNPGELGTAGATAVGVDVSVSRGLDVVILNTRRRLIEPPRTRLGPEDLDALLRRLLPQVVAIDSPPKFGLHGRSRSAEQELRRHGIQVFATPSDPQQSEHKFYAWIREGQRAFRAAEAAGYSLYLGGHTVNGKAIEVFPHASAVVLRGILPARDISRKKSLKREWRKAALEAEGVPTSALSSLDAIDAALAALTGLMALAGEASAVGDAQEGVIVLPAKYIPNQFSREVPGGRG